MRVAVLPLAALMVAGCHTYRPLAGMPPAEGMRIRILLTDSGSTALSGYIGPQVAELHGRVTAADKDGITLSVTSIVTRDGVAPFWKGESATIPATLIARTEEERLAKAKTVGMAGAGLALVVAIARGFGLSGSNDPPRGGGGGPGPR